MSGSDSDSDSSPRELVETKVDLSISEKEEKKIKKKDKKEKKDKKDKKDKKSKSSSKDKKEKSSKRDLEEIEIDLNEPEPLSKKQKRLLKKNKLNIKTEPTEEEKKKNEEKKSDMNGKKSKYGAWVGNLSFDTTADDIRRFLVFKTKYYGAKKPDTKEDDNNENEENENENENEISEVDHTSRLTPILDEDVLRVFLPTASHSTKNKGYAYVDFSSQKQLTTAISLSEEFLNGRNLLIKDATSYEGRPKKEHTVTGGVSVSKNPPSKILFVGNLSFDTTKDQVEQNFQHCGEITKIRMATFEDTGKCKGFAFIDFMDVEGATKGLTDKSCWSLNGRKLRMEYGEDRSNRRPKSTRPQSSFRERGENENKNHTEPSDSTSSAPREFKHTNNDDKPWESQKPQRSFEKKRFNSYNSQRKIKSGLALATAQRQSVSIVPSSGKKIKFD